MPRKRAAYGSEETPGAQKHEDGDERFYKRAFMWQIRGQGKKMTLLELLNKRDSIEFIQELIWKIL